ncbi:transglutaminase family protein [Rufibacter glacialis]|uniref:Transglutaminase family protein n=1 Tax=Rufibacter glacialis TaxID=1259555 RepID=A0A5M8QBS3_9BACT|nr:transglutaminase family protein [Rufibacter glacialis]KAA6432404.1 transglutaminase family protein [Rufibacter glacialis]GGK78399.1 transglutaminase [Rufibacter glacialis]
MKTEYEVVYSTQNIYEETVREAFYSFLVLPCHDDSQVVRHLSLSNSLEAEVFHHPNAFGFEVTSLHTVKPFQVFEFQMRALVEKTAPLFPLEGILSVPEEQQLLCDHLFYLENHLFLGAGQYTQIKEAYRPGLLMRAPDQLVYDYLQQLNRFVHGLLEFDPEPTHVCTTANEVLKLRRGVCQDFTHLFIGIARLNQIPCRYVSGYLNQGLNLTGSAVMHAWAEAYIPGFGWQGFDPTNHLLADGHYLKAAHGSDYADCSPLRGTLKTNGGHKTTYGVTVTPLEPPQAAQQQQQQAQSTLSL